MSRRVVITGVGCVSPLAHNALATWEQLLAGRSGVDHISLFDTAGLPVSIAAEVKDWSISDAPGVPRQTQFAVASAEEAVAQAGLLDAPPDPARLSVYLGCGEIFPDLPTVTQLVAESIDAKGFQLSEYMQRAARARQLCEMCYEPSDAAIRIAAKFGAQGMVANCIAACASSSQAIGRAADLIRYNDADAVITGGAHSLVSSFGVSGFSRLSALTTSWNDDPQHAMRPFDANRDGFVIGEGGAALVLEEREHAIARGATILAEVAGFGTANDAHRLTDPHPTGRGAATAITNALRDAQLNPSDIDYLSAHGTSTPMNDQMETMAIKTALQESARSLPISSNKSMVGQSTTACGALEAVACVQTLLHHAIPPTINYESPDPNCDLDYTPGAARDLRCRHVLSNSFGFGGQNVALVFSQA